MLNAYIFMDDESATLIEYPIIQVEDDTTELTTDQIREIFLNFFHNHSSEDITEEKCANWSKEKIGQAMWDIHCLMLNSVALIKPEHEVAIKAIGNSLDDQFGDDSSTYAACETFATTLKSLAVRVIDFPAADSDFYYKDME